MMTTETSTHQCHTCGAMSASEHQCPACRDRFGRRAAAQRTAPRIRSTRSLYAEIHRAEEASRGLCPHCGTQCHGDCRS